MSSDQDGFLSRWAKRKAEAREVEAKAPAPVAAEPAAPEVVEDVDLSTLPSLDSLTPQSDITAFMQRGVPAALRNAAIQRMWVTDPAIRDYIGPSEMSWDFNASGSLYGFGDLAPDMDIAKFVAEITDGPKPVEVAQGEAADEESVAAPIIESDAPAAVHLTHDDADAETDAAEVAVESVAAPLPLPIRRRHGGAIPR